MENKYKNPKNLIHCRGYVYNIHFHIVWITKYRNKIFATHKLKNAMTNIIKHIAKCGHIQIEKLMVMPDHIHILVSFKPKYSPTNVVRTLKGNSARQFLEKYPRIRQQYCWHNHLWASNYYIGTVGDMSRKTVKKYIANQYKNSNYILK